MGVTWVWGRRRVPRPAIGTMSFMERGDARDRCDGEYARAGPGSLRVGVSRRRSVRAVQRYLAVPGGGFLHGIRIPLRHDVPADGVREEGAHEERRSRPHVLRRAGQAVRVQPLDVRAQLVGDAEGAVLPWGLFFSALTAASVSWAAWMGAKLVFDHKIGTADE